MNSYSTNSLTSVHSTEPSLLVGFGKFFLVPMVLGLSLDMVSTQALGVKTCAFKDGETKCKVYGQTITGLTREFLRVIFQVLHILFALYYIEYLASYARGISSPVGIMGLAAFIMAQPDLFEDIRRLINSLLFKIKYDK
uniref:Uncharacterized protein n=1 Tax=viral metagenome TaxID=1070528 RepID=A0A6C0KXY0_9ZZZZ